MRVAHFFSWYRLLAACLTATAIAQPLAASSGVAFVDLSTVLQQNDRLRESISHLKEDARSFREEVLDERQRLATRASSLERWPESSHLRQREQTALDRQTAALQEKIDQQQSRLLNRESKAYAEAYQRSMRSLEQKCKQQDLPRVVRYQSQPNSRQTGHSNRPLVLGQNADLTEPISRTLNAESNARSLLGFRRDSLPEPVRFMSTLPENAVKGAATARAAWAVDRLVFPPAS